MKPRENERGRGARAEWPALLWLRPLGCAVAVLASSLYAAERTPGSTRDLTQRFSLLYAEGRFEEALPVLEQLLELQRKAHGYEDLSTAPVLNNLALVRRQLGDYVEAEKLATHALEIYENAYGTNHVEFATVLFNVGALFQLTENYSKAEALYRQALRVFEIPPATNYLRTAGAWVNLGGVYLAQGDYGRAEPLFVRARQTYDNAGLSNHTDTAICLNNLGNLYQRLRDYPNAKISYERSLQIRKMNSRAVHRDVAASLVNLGGLCWAMREHEQAEALYLRALQMYGEPAGTNHSQTATCLQNLAVLYRGMGRHSEAEALYQRALDMTEKTVGTNHYRYAIGLNNLAVLYRSMSNSAKALSYCQRALAILEGTGDMDQSGAIGPLKMQAYLKADLGDRPGAIAAWRKCRAAEEKQTARILSFTSEQQRLQFQSQHHFSELLEHIGSAPDAAEIVLRNKAIVLDSLMEDQLLSKASVNPEVKRVLEQLRTAGRRLNRSSEQRASASAMSQRRAALQRAEDEVAGLQKELAGYVNGLGRARRALTVTVPQVQKAIPTQSVLLEWVLYRHYLRNDEWELRYGVVVIPPTNSALRGYAPNEPAWIAVAPAKEIETRLKRYQAAIRGAGDDSMMRELYQQLFEPIEKVLPTDTRFMIISPDGELNFLSFATLLGPDDRFLAEKYLVQYVSSGRDLLWQRPLVAPKDMLVLANPDFNLFIPGQQPPGTGLALRELDREDYRALALAPLPGASKEAEFLNTKAPSWDLECRLRLGGQASEAELNAANSPYILHLGTHGFFLAQPETSDGLEPGAADVLRNPMHRSGLALAGAQRTFAAWAKGETPPTSNDGVLTAQEVAALALQGTWLAVVSACDGGNGEARVGEGVLGLRRGFIMAGVQNLLMALAPISDHTTVALLKDFYQCALDTGNAPRAFAEVQRDWLVKVRKSKGTMEAVRTVGPFVLTFQGKLRTEGPPHPTRNQ